jgi:hypothetical protein
VARGELKEKGPKAAVAVEKLPSLENRFSDMWESLENVRESFDGAVETGRALIGFEFSAFSVVGTISADPNVRMSV